MSIEAMKLALKVLESSLYPQPQQINAITALRQAIQEEALRNVARLGQEIEQEPKCVVIVEVFEKDWRLKYMSLPVGRHKLYAQEYLYTHPPKREWVGLTDEEIKPLCDENHIIYGAYTVDFIQSIEAKLKEKNT